MMYGREKSDSAKRMCSATCLLPVVRWRRRGVEGSYFFK
jgi:hypothetical protein